MLASGMARAWRALRALRLRLLGPEKELVGTDQFGNKYYRVPQHQTGAGTHGVSSRVASPGPGSSAAAFGAGLQGTPPRAERTAPGSAGQSDAFRPRPGLRSGCEGRRAAAGRDLV